MTYPTYIPVKAKVEDTTIWIWWSMKWRPIAYYMRKGTIPGAAKQKEVLRRLALNTGLGPNQKYKIVSWEV